jgi:hypothetical protein
MEDKGRVIATLIIWLSFTLMFGMIAIALVLSQAEINTLGAIFLFSLITMLAMLVNESTGHIWKSRDRARSVDKAKRDQENRVQRLVQSLDDQEIYELEALLLSRDQDGELPRRRTHS